MSRIQESNNPFFSVSDSDLGIRSYESTTLGPEAHWEAVTIANAKSSSFSATDKQQVSTKKNRLTKAVWDGKRVGEVTRWIMLILLFF